MKIHVGTYVIFALIAVVVVVLIFGYSNMKKQQARQAALDAFANAGKGGVKPDEYLDALKDELDEITQGAQTVIDVSNGK